jgi:hypothetical protein
MSDQTRPSATPGDSLKAKIEKYHRDLISRLQPGRTEVLRNCYENILFYLGLQWITYDGTAGNFRRMNLRPGVPRPVVNMYKPMINKFIAMMTGIDPDVATSPGSPNEVDRLTADAAADVIQYLAKIVGVDEIRVKLASTVGLCNNAFLITGYDPDGGRKDFVPKYMDPDGNHVSADVASDNDMKHPDTGKDLKESTEEFDEIPEGAFTTDVITPFEAWVDWTIPRQRDIPAFIWRRMRPLEWIHARYPGAAKDISEDSAPTDIGLVYLQNITRLAPMIGGRFGGSAARYTKSAGVDDMYVLPCKEFPSGKWARLLSTGEMLEQKDYPFHNGTEEEPGDPILPITHFGATEIPGTMLCAGPADDLKSPQRERNRILGGIAMFTARSAASFLYLPEGVDVAQVTGIEGQVLRGQTTAAGGGRPERVEGAPYPQVYVERLKQIDEEMSAIVQIRELSEELPRVDSGYAMQQWEEHKHKEHAPLFLRFETGWAHYYRTLFFVFRNFAPDSVYYKIKGEEARWTVRQIKKADLRGGVDIDIVPGSGQPKTPLQKRAMMEQGVELGIVDIQDPVVRLEYARVYGIRNVMVGFDAQDKAIAMEHEAVVAWAREHFVCDHNDPKFGQALGDDIAPEDSWPVFMDPDVDDNQLHYARHKVWQKSEEFMNLPPAVQEIFRVAHFGPTAQVVGMQLQMPQGPPGSPMQQAGAQGAGQQAAARGGGQTTGQPGSPGQAQMNANATAQATAGGRGYAGRSQNQQKRGAQAAAKQR